MKTRAPLSEIYSSTRVIFRASCPFCTGNREIAALEDIKTGTSGVSHEEPTCKTFDDLPPDEFLREVRRKLQPETFS